MGISACNGMIHMNNMDSDEGEEQSSQRKREASTSPQSGVSPKKISTNPSTSTSGDIININVKDIREKFVVALEKKIKDKFNILLPEAYKSFLIEQSESILYGNSLGPFNIFSFVTPKSESDINPMVSQILKYWLSSRNSMLTMERFIEQKSRQKFWCVASQDIDGVYMYYCIDLKDNDKQLPVYKVGNNGTRYPIYKNIVEFVQYCKDQYTSIKNYNDKNNKGSEITENLQDGDVLMHELEKIEFSEGNNTSCLREKYIAKFKERVKNELGIDLPGAYESFLIKQDESILKEEELGPFEIFYFATPKFDKIENDTIDKLLSNQIDTELIVSKMQEFTEESDSQKFWYVGYQNVNDIYNVYYCIDLKDKNNQLPVYKIDTDGTRHLIFKCIEEFSQYCKDEYRNMIKYNENKLRVCK
ncbi:protein of unknown function [Cardinium endosymbiont cEper1 of Encarsia pergandiella]|uniref:SMI1/KNR4 family protein n=1 Tax=Cardinium endosymbiont of Encarsia pergandiella TaxID=249402 RepID=UPI00027E9C2A|nr:SMI1/KNR4 family protein [Cardinium endosymbiont of Encarsia pergandiella]CCM10594.1 protein of unknown function [Cardinium endosymbiont cEper1 of Encarsia pergandiella]